MLNQKAIALGSSTNPMRGLFEYSLRRSKVIDPENIFDFSLGNPFIPAPAQVNDTIRELLDNTDPLTLHGYTSSIGSYAIRKAVSDDLNQRFQETTTPEEIYITCGAAPALTATLRALSIPDAEVIAIAPFFPEYRIFAEEAGLKLVIVPAKIPSFLPDLDALRKAINHNTQAIILNSPNNPTGVVYPKETLLALRDLIVDKITEIGHTVYFISDEPYRELAYGVEVPFLPSIFRDTIVCYSYSKSLSLPGERIGYVYVSQEATEGKRLYAAIAGASRAMGHICAPSLWQGVVARCAGLQPDLEAYGKNRALLYEGLTAMGYEVVRPDGALYLFFKAPGGDSLAFSEAAKQRDLLIVPADTFGCPGWIRLAYCIPYEKIARSLPVFEELLKEFA